MSAVRRGVRTWACECGCHNGTWRQTCFDCDKPRPEPQKAVVCGKRTVNESGYRTTCLKDAGHKGAC